MQAVEQVSDIENEVKGEDSGFLGRERKFELQAKESREGEPGQETVRTNTVGGWEQSSKIWGNDEERERGEE